MSLKNTGVRSFILLYLKSFSVNTNDEIDEKKLLDYMSREQRRKSIVDRMSQVTLTFEEDSAVLSKPLWWSTSSGQRLPYTQLREAYVFGKDNKRIAIDIFSLDTRQRRILLFKARNLDEREALIELITHRKMAREMYEKDNVHQVQYANWSSTYADDVSHQGSVPHSPVSFVSEQSPPESPGFTKPRGQSLARQSLDPQLKYMTLEEETPERLQIVPVGLSSMSRKPMREISLQSGWNDMDSSRMAMEPWRGDGLRHPGMMTCCGQGHCHHNHQPTPQHTNINIVFSGQPGMPGVVTNSTTGSNTDLSQINLQRSFTPTRTTPIIPEEVEAHRMMNTQQTLSRVQSPPSQWDYSDSTTGNGVRFIEANGPGVYAASSKSLGLKFNNIRRYPSQTNLMKTEKTHVSGMGNRTQSQPDLTIKVNGNEMARTLSRDEQNHVNSSSHTTAYNVTYAPTLQTRAPKETEHKYHTTLVTKTGTLNTPPASNWTITPTRTDHYRDEMFAEKITETTVRSKPTASREIHIIPSKSQSQFSEAHHGWATETQFYQVRNNALAKITQNGSRYWSVSSRPAT
ncbi:unnamed protein product [Echinostoma caproni]|uniref:IRS-type PTB domain-containing protein n=1 Tax=Echinostoma caproni TaxID=27848 RepID=A0A183A6N5_9TREM|nr:unnamed protein product [Echinostoma caproni]